MTDDEAMAIFLALGDKRRFEIFRKVRAEGGMSATDLSLGKAASTISHHLAKLEKAGVLKAKRSGKTKRYSVDAAKLHAFSEWVSASATDAEFSGFDQVLLTIG
ncbi:ArsR/SmtB family transcription factor [Devosia sp. A369]